MLKDLLHESNRTFIAMLAHVDKQKPVSEDLRVHGHKATANGFCDRRHAFTERHSAIATVASRTLQHGDATALKNALLELSDHHEHYLKKVNPLEGWDISPRYELALRAEIGIKVRRINTLREDILHMLPSRITAIIATHDVSLLEELLTVMKDSISMDHAPRITRFDKLHEFMNNLLSLDTRLHDLRRALKDVH